jgi:hypothetical protein
MVAEILLYSTLYRLLHRQGSNERRAGEEGGELELWREQWDYLFRIPPFPYYLPFTGYCVTELTGLGQEGHQYIEIGYYFAHLMLHAQALKLLDDGKQTPIESGSPASAARTPSDMPPSTYDAKKTHMSAISQLSTQILSRARRVEITEIRVPLPHSVIISKLICSMLPISYTSSSHLQASVSAVYSPPSQSSETSKPMNTEQP